MPCSLKGHSSKLEWEKSIEQDLFSVFYLDLAVQPLTFINNILEWNQESAT